MEVMSFVDRVARHARLTAKVWEDLPSPPFLVLFINSICNMKCEHCFYWTALNKKDDLSKEEIFQLSDDLGKIENLNLSGGEPFLRKEFAEIVLKFVRTNGVRQIYVPSNGYFTDRCVAAVTEVLKEKELDLFVVDCLRYEPHPTHAHFDQAVTWAEQLKPRHSVLTHMNHLVDYDVIKAKCPPGVEPAYDGLEIEVPEHVPLRHEHHRLRVADSLVRSWRVLDRVEHPPGVLDRLGVVGNHLTSLLQELLDERQGGGFADIVGAWLERQSPYGNPLAGEVRDELLDPRHVGLLVELVDLIDGAEDHPDAAGA